MLVTVVCVLVGCSFCCLLLQVIPEHVFLPLDPDAPDSQTPEGLLMVGV
jgi:hypothetical protein